MDCLRNVSQRVNNLFFQFSLVAMIAACLIFSSCNRERNMRSTLANIETYIDEHPDSALKSINAIDSNAVQGRRVKAKYALLKSLALNKNHIEVSDDSLTRIALAWYSKHGTTEEKAKSYYCEGRVQQDAEDYNSAIVSFTEAEENADKAGDYYVEGLIQRCIAEIYNHTYQKEDELRYHRMAYESFKKAGKVPHSRYELLNIANALQNRGEFADADRLYSKLLAISKKEGDEPLMAGVLYSYSAMCVNKVNPDPAKAIKLLYTLRDTLHYGLDASNLGDLAYAYALLGEKGKAKEFLKGADTLSAGASARAEFMDASYNVAKYAGDYRSALASLESASKIQDSLLNVMLDQSVNVSQKEYYRQRAASAEDSRLNERKISILSIACLILLLTIVAYLAYRAINSRNERIREYQIKVREALLEKEEVGRELERRKMSVAREFRDKLDTVGKLAMSHYEYASDASARMKAEDKEVKRIISELSGEKTTAKLEAELDEAMDGIMTKLKKEMPRFKDGDFRLMSYWFSGFPTEVICLLMGAEKDWVYKRKNRLKERIALSNAPDRNLFQKNMGNY
jgi:hypothetical protein